MLNTNHVVLTNQGSQLMEQSKTQFKTLVFSVRMTTNYISGTEYPHNSGKDKAWFGDVVGEIIGASSHVTINAVSEVCHTKLAVKCTDNSQRWKTVSIWAHFEDESYEYLFACLSRENGDFNNVTILELPVTLDGVVDDFGFQECSTQDTNTGTSPRSVSLITKEDDGGYAMHLTALEAENIDAQSITLNGSDLETIIHRICDARIAQAMSGSGSSSSSSGNTSSGSNEPIPDDDTVSLDDGQSM